MAIILASILCGCGKRPEGVLSDDEMVDFLTDMSIAEAIQQSPGGVELPDSVRRRLGYSVMKAHGIDQASLDSTYAWYSRNVDDYYELYARVEKRLNKELRKSGAKDNGMENNVWNLPDHLLFSPNGNSDVLVFQLPGSSIAKGESLEWKMRFGNSSDAGVIIGIDYDDGTTSLVQRDFRGERRADLSIQSDTSRVAKRIFGSVTVPRRSMPLFVDSISLAKLPYDSTTYSNFRFQRFSYGPRKRPRVENTDSVKGDAEKPAEVESVPQTAKMRDSREGMEKMRSVPGRDNAGRHTDREHPRKKRPKFESGSPSTTGIGMPSGADRNRLKPKPNRR